MKRFGVVLCGSFHKDSISLGRAYRELETTNCKVLSPLSLEFTDQNDSFVKTKYENHFSAGELESFHLRAIHEADFIWLHCPSGYIGISAAFEIGYAKATQKPVYAHILPADEMLRSYVIQVVSVFEAIEHFEKQQYITIL